MEKVDTAILKTKAIIYGAVALGCFENVFNFKGYKRFYLYSNENIDDYLSFTSFDNKDTALSVTASGDQVFSLISQGIKKIDTFDINGLTEYYVLGLKRAMIIKYNYQEFLDISYKIFDYNYSSNENVSLEELTSILTDLLSFMDKKERYYWQNIISYNYKLQSMENTNYNLFDIIGIFFGNFNFPVTRSSYLKTEEDYNRLRSNIINAELTYQNTHVLDLPTKLNSKYDLILFSNVLDYCDDKLGYCWLYKDIEPFFKEMESLLRENGVFFMHYLFGKQCVNVSSLPIFTSSLVEENDLKDYEILNIKDCNDKMLLKRG